MLPLFLLTIARFLHFGLSFRLHRARMISILSISTFLYNIQEGKSLLQTKTHNFLLRNITYANVNVYSKYFL